MNISNIINLVFSPISTILFLFLILLFGKGFFYFMELPQKLIILATVVSLNMVLPYIVYRKLKSERFITFLIISILFITSLYIVASYIYFGLVLSLYTSAMLVLGISLILNLDMQSMSFAAFLSFCSLLIFYDMYDLTLILSLSAVVLSTILLYNAISKRVEIKRLLISFLAGVVAVAVTQLLVRL